MARLKVPSLKSLKLFIENPALGDPTIPSGPITLSLKQEFTEEISEAGAVSGGVRVNAGLETKLVVVNDALDLNAEEFFDLGAPPHAAEDPEAAPAIEPPVRFDAGRAYVVLAGVSASGRLKGAGEVSALRVGLDGTANLTLASCTHFDRETLLQDATNDVIEHFKTVFSLSDLAALRPQETLAAGYGGTLKLALELSSSCLGDAVAAGLQGALGRAVPIDIGVSPTAALEVTAEFSDGYRLYAHGGDKTGRVTFSVRKASSRVLGLDGSVGLRVDLRDGQALVKALASSMAALVKLPAAFVERALASSALEELSPEEQGYVEKAVDLLKLRDPAIPAWRRFKQVLTEAEKQARAVIPQKLSAGLKYTWRRITTDTHVARFSVDRAALERHHGNILRLDLQPLIEEAKSGMSGIVFDRFLGKKLRKVDVGFGFCLSLNDFVFLKGWDSRTQRYIWLRDLDGRLQVSFLGKRAYEGTWLGASEGHAVELDASMPRFTAPPARARDFDLGFHLAFTWTNRRFDSILAEVADHAALVQALPATTVPEALQALQLDTPLSDWRGDAVVSLLVPGTVIESLLAQMTGAERDELLARALARALPCGEFGAHFETRREIEKRTAAYDPLWRAFLRTPEITPDDFARTAARVIEEIDPKLSRQERDTSQHWGWSAHGVVRNFGGPAALHRACDELRFGLDLLATRAAVAADHRIFEQAVKSFSPLWSDHYGARVFGSYLLLAAQRQPGVLSRIGRKVSLRWSRDGIDHARVYKQGDETL
jgi:hypothetical protein